LIHKGDTMEDEPCIYVLRKLIMYFMLEIIQIHNDLLL
jgi:hypothetical protein